MSSIRDQEYENAVQTLNLYQARADVQETSKVPRKPAGPASLERSREFFSRCGHELEELDKLKAIHIAGTKGKGSVSAMCESILRRYGLKTGLLTSPHLLEVRERIRINGCSLSHGQFAQYFWECYTKLDRSKKSVTNMPNYYRLLTLVAFHSFLRKKVDVAIIEVGKGGAYDTTNILPHPAVCGITVLDVDHTNELGDTLEKIAWHKTGIFKPGHPVFILPQEPGPLQVISERAEELQVSSIAVVPGLEKYPGEKVGMTTHTVIGIAGDHNKTNASIAVQICRKWLHLRGLWTANHIYEPSVVSKESQIYTAHPFHLPRQFYDGLRLCKWPGRSHIEKRNGITFYLDAAHTPLSIEACVSWFQNAATTEVRSKGNDTRVVRVLLFNFLGNRDAKILLKPLLNCGFDYALFAPSFTGIGGTNTPDQTYRKATQQSQCESSLANEQVWLELNSLKHKEAFSEHIQPACNGDDSSIWPNPVATRYFSSLDQAIQWCSTGRGLIVRTTSPGKDLPTSEPPVDLTTAEHIQVLVTGSVRLVGTAMYVLGCTVD